MTELILLPLLKALPYGGMQSTSPVTQEEAVAWAEKYKSSIVYFWLKTKSAFIPYRDERPGH